MVLTVITVVCDIFHQPR